MYYYAPKEKYFKGSKMNNEVETCINCNIKPIYIKKRKLCKKCYGGFYRHTIKGAGFKWKKKTYSEKIFYSSEIEFSKNFFDHKNWIYHPVMFRLNGTTYQPDFYDGERNVFIEVVGSRSAFQNNKHKYIDFMKIFPKINFEIMLVSGEIIDIFQQIQEITEIK